jgi:hypothetical protein
VKGTTILVAKIIERGLDPAVEVARIEGRVECHLRPKLRQGRVGEEENETAHRPVDRCGLLEPREPVPLGDRRRGEGECALALKDRPYGAPSHRSEEVEPSTRESEPGDVPGEHQVVHLGYAGTIAGEAHQLGEPFRVGAR